MDWEVGYEYHVDAANAGYAPAQFNTGTHYFLGQGVEQNLDTAVEWFKKASEEEAEKDLDERIAAVSHYSFFQCDVLSEMMYVVQVFDWAKQVVEQLDVLSLVACTWQHAAICAWP